MRVDAVAFDLDGTLIDSNDAWNDGLNKTLKLYGRDEDVTKEYFLENHVGVEQKQVITHHLDLSEEELERAVDRFNEIYISSIDHVKLQDNALDLLEYVSGRNWKKAIITNAYMDVTDAILDNLASRNMDIKRYFDTIVTRDTVKEGKPNPEIIYIACKRLGVRPENMIFIEDSTSGIIAGKNAGCHVIAVTSTTPREKLQTAGADKTVPNLTALKKVIAEITD